MTRTKKPLTNFEDVRIFHKKFKLNGSNSFPWPLKPDVLAFRIVTLKEELQEFIEASDSKDLEGQIDALIDLVYFALGTADLLGFDWQPHWDEVQKKNMEKVRAQKVSDSKRESTYDVVKPEGWTAPDHTKVAMEIY